MYIMHFLYDQCKIHTEKGYKRVKYYWCLKKQYMYHSNNNFPIHYTRHSLSTTCSGKYE